MSMTKSTTESGQPVRLDAVAFLGVLFESAVEAFFRSVAVTILGSLAIGVAGSIWSSMTPSHPPGFGDHPGTAVPPLQSTSAVFLPFRDHPFLVVFGFIYLTTVTARLGWRRYLPATLSEASRVARIHARLSDHWFALLVGNAFGALISAMVFVWIQQFALSRLLLRWAMDLLLAQLQHLSQWLFGTHDGSALQPWFNWYGDNQLKFTFWVFYLAAICDDLGLPNFKSLGRWLGRKIRQRRKAKPAVRSEQPAADFHQDAR
jgi:hypothetical protein